MSVVSFDAETYKQTTREQWQQAAEAWSAWGPTLERWLGEATELMLDRCEVGPGARVIDVAAGAGGQTIAAAQRVGEDGSVLATDISPAILEYAQREALRTGLRNVATREVDGERLAVAPGTFDAAISRLGLIYLPDQARALAEQREALREGGHIGAIVYSSAERNGFFSVPVSIIRRRAGLPAPPPGQPGPFSLSDPAALEQMLATAGFREIEVSVLDAPLRLASTAECMRFERESFGALHQMLAGLDDAGRAAAWAEIESELEAFEDEDGFVAPCELLVASGRKPG